MNKDYPNGTNTPVIEQEEMEKSMRPNYMILDLEDQEEPLFFITLDGVHKRMMDVVDSIMPEDPEVYLQENIQVRDLNTGERVRFDTKVTVGVTFRD